MSKIDDYIIFEYLEGNLPDEQASAVRQQIKNDPKLSLTTEGFAASFIDNSPMKIASQTSLLKPWYAGIPWSSIGLGCALVIGVIIFWSKTEETTIPSQVEIPLNSKSESHQVISSPVKKTNKAFSPTITKVTPPNETDKMKPKNKLPVIAITTEPEQTTESNPETVKKEVIKQDLAELAIPKQEVKSIAEQVEDLPPNQDVKKATTEIVQKTTSKFAKKEMRRQEKHLWKLQKQREKRASPTLKETLKGLKWNASPPVKLED